MALDPTVLALVSPGSLKKLNDLILQVEKDAAGEEVPVYGRLGAYAAIIIIVARLLSADQKREYDSKKLIKVKKVFEAFDEWYYGGSLDLGNLVTIRGGASFFVPGPMVETMRAKFFGLVVERELPQIGHTERWRITKGRPGRPKKGDAVSIRIKTLRP